MKALNVKALFLASVIAIASFSSCKKNNDDVAAPPPTPTIEGTWVGKYGIGNNTPDKYFSFIIKKDGTLQAKSDNPNKEYNGTGTWKLEGGTFTAIYQYTGLFIKYSVAAKTDVAAGTMNGSYGGEDKPDDGTFFMNRQ